jgi:hypothetical protein
MYNYKNLNTLDYVRKRVETVRKETNPDFPILIVAAQCDQKEVCYKGRKLAGELRAMHIEISSYTRYNLEEVIPLLYLYVQRNGDFDYGQLVQDMNAGKMPELKHGKKKCIIT